MKTLHLPPEPQRVPANADEPATRIDTSKMSAGQRAALELAEAARDPDSGRGTFAGGLFMGRFDLEGVLPFPAQTAEDRDQGDAFLHRLETFLRAHVDPDEIDRTGEIPPAVIEELARMGAFGIKISPAYGGLGLSQTNYCRAAMLLGSYCGNLTALLSAHQSIGVPQPLILFGTEEQKRRYLPRVAKGEISAFALTESGVGSDPARMETHAEPTADGKHFLLNGEKLWCTNGTKAGVIVVMAKTPPKTQNGKSKTLITAFIVETDWPGVEIVRRCRFMGLRALYNGVLRFTNVLVPRENILLAEGKGLRVALSTLNTGRLTLPAACVGMSKRCLEISRQWAREREQWGAPIGRHSAIADKLARMAANTFAMEAMALLAASPVDRDKHADVRLEAALAKLWATERTWEMVNDTMQIRGGRGYETADSLKARGEDPVPVERMMRDSRINTIFEGSSEIMRLFIAREALDPHLKIAGDALNSQLPLGRRLQSALKAGLFYAGWYPKLFLPRFKVQSSKFKVHPALARHLHCAGRTGRRLALALFHAMVRFGPKLEREQVLLGRLVDIGADLFAITATCSRGQSLLPGRSADEQKELLGLVDYFCHSAQLRMEENFRRLWDNTDRQGYRLAQQVLKGDLDWLSDGMVGKKM
jgi:alkylation response protein AidB-like acyl-CoA dehydrogenase